MLVILLGLLDIVTSIMALYSLTSGAYLVALNYLIPLLLIKGCWSVYSYPPGLIGWLDVVAPLLFWASTIFNAPWIISYIALIFVFGKGLFSIMFTLK